MRQQSRNGMIDKAQSRDSTQTTASHLPSSASSPLQTRPERLRYDISSSAATHRVIDSTPISSTQSIMDSQGIGANSANNSSDFVRKLYKMLEDPSYSSVVRWGDDGDSFVVLENEKFTKSILPKHFKHSNFASFVRQLNKYDFHKVRQNNEEGATSIYGPNAWEFRHPEFRANSKDSLDNIRRKAPAPRKVSQITDEQLPIQQIDLMNQQLVAQAQQLEQLSGRFTELSINHQMMLQEVLRVQKTVLNHEHVIQDVMTFLHSVDAKQRRDSKTGAIYPPPSNEQVQSGSTLTPTSQNMPPPEDEPSSPLQHASKLLKDLHADVQFNMSSLEQLQDNIQRTGFASTPPIDQNARAATVQAPAPTSAGSSSTMGYRELDHVVYPMGTNNGIDPMYSEHVHNIPYSLPSKELDPSDPRRQYVDGRKKSTFSDPGWARSPRILLVEDDPTCRQIGSKFLYSFRCVVDTALDGLEAVNKMQEGVKYDMILMDIIMPNLDGVSACHIIRQFDRTPIVAMTSNIRSDDIQMYFHHGMDDVLPKPFTRKSLLDMLEKHLIHLKANALGIEPAPQSAITPSVAQSSTSHSVVDGSSPAQSPAGSLGNWQSPGQFNGVSPIHTNIHNQYATIQNHSPYLDQGGSNSTFHSPQTPSGSRLPSQQNPPPPHRRQISEMTGAPEMEGFSKRQRIHPPSMSGRQQ